MTLIKSHTCATCGGALTFHSDRKQYECPYCSVYFDYKYFHSQDILDQADSSLKILQYDSAKEKYEFVLQKELNNFRAFVGKFLCDAKINKMSELGRIENLSNIDLSLIKDYEAKALPENKPFFSKLSEMRAYAEQSAETLKSIEEIEKMNLRKGNLVQDLSDEDFKRARSHESSVERNKRKYIFNIIWVLFFSPLVLIALLKVIKWTTLLVVILLIGIILGVVFLAYRGYKEEKERKIRLKLAEKHDVDDEGTGPVYTHSDLERMRILNELKKNGKDISRTFDKLCKELAELQPKTGSRSGKSQEEELIQADLSKSPACTKCGGELIVNLNSLVYECPFCGVTFDFDFLRDETALEDAREAVSKSQFVKADGIWKYILAIEPKNFEALRGRILCAAKWTQLPSENALSSMAKIYLPVMEKRCAEAAASCEEKDRKYFDKLNQVVAEYDKYKKNTNPGEPVRKEYSRLLKKLSDQSNYVFDLAMASFPLDGDLTEEELEKLYIEKSLQVYTSAADFISAYQYRESLKKQAMEIAVKTGELNEEAARMAQAIESGLEELREMEVLKNDIS